MPKTKSESETRYTPGPWVAKNGAIGWLVGPKGAAIASIGHSGVGPHGSYKEGNAHLIAAAPAYAQAWAMVPEEIREQVLRAVEPWVTDALKDRGGGQ